MKISDLFKTKNPRCHFIADIAANHDGDIIKAKELIHAAAESGADSAKFQNFTAETIVSDIGFKLLGKKFSHQSKWKKTIFETYKDAELPMEWTYELIQECKKNNIEYFTASYDKHFTKLLSEKISVMKMGSGEITWHEHISLMADLYEILILATGASKFHEVIELMSLVKNNKTIIMQCNTDYTAKAKDSDETINERLACINLKVLEKYKENFPNSILGLSDHTHGDTTVLGAIGLYGVKAVEKHFTLQNEDIGPDHPFSMTPSSWKIMVKKSRQIEENVDSSSNFDEKLKIVSELVDNKKGLLLAIGDGEKKIERNETDTVILQRRCFYAARNVSKENIITEKDIIPLRPCLENSFSACEKKNLVGKKLLQNLTKGECIFKNQIS